MNECNGEPRDGRSVSVREYMILVEKHGRMGLMRQNGYVLMKSYPRNVSFADGNVGAIVIITIQEGKFPRANTSSLRLLALDIQ